MEIINVSEKNKIFFKKIDNFMNELKLHYAEIDCDKDISKCTPAQICLRAANNNLWKFDLTSIPEPIQYTEYLATNKGHYDWHADIGPGILSKRKISITWSKSMHFANSFLKHKKIFPSLNEIQ